MQEPVPLFELPFSLDLGRPLTLAHLDVVVTHLGRVLLLTIPRVRLLILHLLAARPSVTASIELPLLNLCSAASRVAVVRTGLNLQRDLPALSLPIEMVVLPVLCLRRCGNEQERRRG